MRFEIQYSFLSDFVKSVDKVIHKPSYITFLRSGGVLYLGCESEVNAVVGSLKSIGEDFNFKLESESFMGLVKKLYEGTIKFAVKKSHVKVTIDNIKVQLTRSGYGNIPSYSLEGTFSGNLEDLHLGLSNMFSSCGINKKYGGILVEDDFICSFSDSALFIESIMGFSGRFVIPVDVARLLKSFKSKEIDSLYAGKSFVVRLKSGIDLLFSYVQDKYPKEFQNYLKLSDICLSKCYSFESDDLRRVVDLVSSVSGTSEIMVRFELAGSSEEGLVWKLSCKNFRNTKVEELLESTGKLTGQSAFRVNKKNLKKFLQGITGSANMYLTDSFCCLYAEDPIREYRMLSIAKG